MTPGDCCCGHKEVDHMIDGQCIGGGAFEPGGVCECEEYERYLGPFDGE